MNKLITLSISIIVFCGLVITTTAGCANNRKPEPAARPTKPAVMLSAKMQKNIDEAIIYYCINIPVSKGKRTGYYSGHKFLPGYEFCTLTMQNADDANPLTTFRTATLVIKPDRQLLLLNGLPNPYIPTGKVIDFINEYVTMPDYNETTLLDFARLYSALNGGWVIDKENQAYNKPGILPEISAKKKNIVFYYTFGQIYSQYCSITFLPDGKIDVIDELYSENMKLPVKKTPHTDKTPKYKTKSFSKKDQAIVNELMAYLSCNILSSQEIIIEGNHPFIRALKRYLPGYKYFSIRIQYLFRMKGPESYPFLMLITQENTPLLLEYHHYCDINRDFIRTIKPIDFMNEKVKIPDEIDKDTALELATLFSCLCQCRIITQPETVNDGLKQKQCPAPEFTTDKNGDKKIIFYMEYDSNIESINKYEMIFGKDGKITVTTEHFSRHGGYL